MGKLSEKYVAGLMDADGYIGLKTWKNGARATINSEFSQRADRAEVLYMIQEQFGGSMKVKHVGDTDYCRLYLGRKETTMMLSRIAQHLVNRRAYAYRLLELDGSTKCTDELNSEIKEARNLRSLPVPNFPSRNWLAGYFDGDGSVFVEKLSGSGGAYIRINIACDNFDTEGIETISKNFGGKIVNGPGEKYKLWNLHSIHPSKAEHFFGYFGKHSIIKKAQIDFVLGCAAMGHFRDGASIKAALKQLKAHPHRLSDSSGLVNVLLKTVKNLPPISGEHKARVRQSA